MRTNQFNRYKLYWPNLTMTFLTDLKNKLLCVANNKVVISYVHTKVFLECSIFSNTQFMMFLFRISEKMLIVAIRPATPGSIPLTTASNGTAMVK